MSGAQGFQIYQLIRDYMNQNAEKEKDANLNDAQTRLSARMAQPDQFGTPFEVTEQDRQDYATATGGLAWPQREQTIGEVIKQHQPIQEREGWTPYLNPEDMPPQDIDATPLTPQRRASRQAEAQASGKLAGQDNLYSALTQRFNDLTGAPADGVGPTQPPPAGAPTIGDIFANAYGITRQKPSAPQPIKTWGLPGGGTTNLPTGTMPPEGATPWSKTSEKSPEDKLTQLGQKAHSSMMRLFGQNEMSGLDPNLAPNVNRATTRAMEMFEGYLLDDPATAWPRALGDAYQEVTGQRAALDRLPSKTTGLFGGVKNEAEAKQMVADARARGVDDAQIKEQLLGQRWQPAEIEKMMGTTGPQPSAPPTVQTPEVAPQSAVSDDQAQARYNEFRAKGYTPDQATAMAYGN